MGRITFMGRQFNLHFILQLINQVFALCMQQKGSTETGRDDMLLLKTLQCERAQGMSLSKLHANVMKNRTISGVLTFFLKMTQMKKS